MTPLQQAAKAVMDRWDSNEYNNAYLGVHITTLRKALADEQAQAVEPIQRHLPENVARLLIEHYLKDEHGYADGSYSIEKQGYAGYESHSWAFWILSDDSTSYLHEDGRIEWCGTAWEPTEQAQAVEPATGERDHVPESRFGNTERAELIHWLRERSMWDGMIRLIDAADMLEADAQEIARSQAECDTIAEMNHAQWLAQEVVVPAWVPMTEKLLISQEPWLYQPIWIAGEFGVEQATYEWRQGRYPHCFDTSDGHGRGLSEITHAMPIEIPASPQGAKK